MFTEKNECADGGMGTLTMAFVFEVERINSLSSKDGTKKENDKRDDKNPNITDQNVKGAEEGSGNLTGSKRESSQTVSNLEHQVNNMVEQRSQDQMPSPPDNPEKCRNNDGKRSSYMQ